MIPLLLTLATGLTSEPSEMEGALRIVKEQGTTIYQERVINLDVAGLGFLLPVKARITGKIYTPSCSELTDVSLATLTTEVLVPSLFGRRTETVVAKATVDGRKVRLEIRASDGLVVGDSANQWLADAVIDCVISGY
ncbi:MAG: hypothetical protein V1664_00020 [Candidatus Uhrbacteria bacterium]